MRKKMNKEQTTLMQLIIGILLWGGLVQIPGLIAAPEKLRFSAGLWCGILMSCGMAVHMYMTLTDAMEMDPENAAKKVRNGYGLRITVVTVLSCLIVYFRIGSIVSCFLGLMAMKPAAYFQPFLEKLMFQKSDK